MEPYYYQKMNKPQQAAYHAKQQGALALADEIQLPRIPAEELYDVFFRLRLDHPEIFWVVSYRYRYYQDSSNIIFVPEYLFEKLYFESLFAVGVVACSVRCGTNRFCSPRSTRLARQSPFSRCIRVYR